MKKTILFAVLLFCLVFVLASCGSGETTAPTTTTAPSTTTAPETTEVEIPLNCTAELIHYGPVSLESGRSRIIIFNDDSFIPFCSEWFISHNIQLENKYNATFFKDNHVAAIYVFTPSGLCRPFLDSITQNKNTGAISAKIGIDRPSEVTHDCDGWIILVSFPKIEGFETISGTVEVLPDTVLDYDEFREKYPVEAAPVPDNAWMEKVEMPAYYPLEFLFSGEAGDVVEVNEEGAVGALIRLDDQYQTAEQYQEYKELYYINGDVHGKTVPRIHVFVKNADDLKKLASLPGIARISFNYIPSNE
ncbi:MAG: hypothetical protein IKC63_06780 [Clostridia bacterium]|nr:hypothetical protein [Clostridia bacterium]